MRTRSTPPTARRRTSSLFAAPLLITALVTEVVTGLTGAGPHDGNVVLAFPVEGIRLDGRFDDWPEGLEEIPMDEFGGSFPKDGADLSAVLRVGYDELEETLVVAVRVRDQTHRCDPDTPAALGDEDSCTLYLELSHGITSAPPSVVVAGLDATTSKLRRFGDDDQVEAAVWRGEGTTQYEWRIRPVDGLPFGASIGFDVVVTDRDGEGDARVAMWGSEDGAAFGGGRLGDLVVADPFAYPGTLTGRVAYADADLPQPPARVRITSTDNPALWVQAAVDPIGRYRLQLPSGSYRVTPAFQLSLPHANDLSAPQRRLTADAAARVEVPADGSVDAGMLLLETEPSPTWPSSERGLLVDLDEQAIATLEERVRASMRHYDIPAVSLVLLHDGRVAHHGMYGEADRHSHAALNASHLFEAASITKPVFAFAAMRLVERGLLDLDRPLHEYLAFPNLAADERSKRLTARHVLSHRSGLPNWAFGGPGGHRNGEPLTLSFEPGQRFQYSGEAFNYLGRVLESITGEGLEALLQREVAQPSGMRQAHFSADPSWTAQAVRGHFAHQPSYVPPPVEVSPASSLHTEARDFANFMLTLLERRGLGPDAYAEMLRPHTEVPAADRVHAVPIRQSVTLGFFVQETQHGLLIEHGGNNGDFRCKFGLFPEARMGYAVFTNGNAGERLVRALELCLVGEGLADE